MLSFLVFTENVCHYDIGKIFMVFAHTHFTVILVKAPHLWMCCFENFCSVFPSKIIFIPATPEFINYLQNENPAIGGRDCRGKMQFYFYLLRVHQTSRMLSQSQAGLVADNEIHQEWESAQNIGLEITWFVFLFWNKANPTNSRPDNSTHTAASHFASPCSGTNTAEPKGIHTSWTALILWLLWQQTWIKPHTFLLQYLFMISWRCMHLVTKPL